MVAPTITSGGGGAAASIQIPENQQFITTVTATDPDSGTLSYSLIGGADRYRMVIDSVTGALSFYDPIYTNFEFNSDSDGDGTFEVTVQVSDGTLVDTQTISVTRSDVNEAPTIGATTVSVAVTENNDYVRLISIYASDPDDGAILSYSIIGGADQSKFSINASTGRLTFKNSPNFESPADADSNNSYVVQVQASDGALSDEQTIIVNIDDSNEEPIFSSYSSSEYVELTIAEETTAELGQASAFDPEGSAISYSISGDSAVKIDASTGVFSFISIPDYETDGSYYSFWVYASDGQREASQYFSVTVVNTPEGGQGGAPLLDAAYYYETNPDVLEIGAAAFQHYNSFGWQEGRDPNEFFDTSWYLAVNPDVAASGVNPLEHYQEIGWLEGRDPGPNFDVQLYLLNNPDVAATGVDPLSHFLLFGQSEGRATYAAIGTPVAGFDAVYYLSANPDVAAAGVDPGTHYKALGQFEGRNPNAYFDTEGYLSQYTDVAAAGIDPLEHYMTFGWLEGRDPSASFDTAGYLAANPDVAAARLNPLQHFLEFGIYEGRVAVDDGQWS